MKSTRAELKRIERKHLLMHELRRVGYKIYDPRTVCDFIAVKDGSLIRGVYLIAADMTHYKKVKEVRDTVARIEPDLFVKI